MKKIIYTKSFIVFLIIPILFGCSDNLNRNEAENLIKSKLQLPKEDIRALCVYDATLSNSITRDNFEQLQNEGLLTYSECGSGLNSGYCATLTDKGKQYAVSEEYTTDNMYINNINVRAATIDFGEITGIIEHKEFNVAEVQYTIVRKDITPFGKIAFNIQDGMIAESAMFRKYDDGWRIE